MYKYKTKTNQKALTKKMKTGYIYRLWSPGSQEFYIGSTTHLKSRKRHHKCSCVKVGNKDYNYPVYQHIRANGGWTNWRLDMEHTIQFNDRSELTRVEGEYIRRLKPALNVRIEGRTKKEWQKEYQQVNKQSIAEYHKQYQQKNKEKIKQKQKIKYDCQCGGKYTHQNKIQHSKSLKHKNYINTWMDYI